MCLKCVCRWSLTQSLYYKVEVKTSSLFFPAEKYSSNGWNHCTCIYVYLLLDRYHILLLRHLTMGEYPFLSWSYQRIIVWLQTHLMYKNYVNKSEFVKYVVLFYMLCVYVTTIVNTQCFYIQINEYVFLC